LNEPIWEHIASARVPTEWYSDVAGIIVEDFFNAVCGWSRQLAASIAIVFLLVAAILIVAIGFSMPRIGWP
jgi:hypothetical protein